MHAVESSISMSHSSKLAKKTCHVKVICPDRYLTLRRGEEGFTKSPKDYVLQCLF